MSYEKKRRLPENFPVDGTLSASDLDRRDKYFMTTFCFTTFSFISLAKFEMHGRDNMKEIHPSTEWIPRHRLVVCKCRVYGELSRDGQQLGRWNN